MSQKEASSPGKVLILGGYLIVEAPNVGISIGTTARFTTRVTSCSGAADGCCRVRVLSPQFGKQFTFACSILTEPDVMVSVTQTEGPASPFMYYGVLYAVAAALSQGGDVRREVEMELLADNDFYSQRNHLESKGQTVSVASLRALPSHVPLVGEISKTGLGSSAAMTTSFVACLFRLLKSDGAAPVELMHRVAQIAHSVAQGKIGSGFDVYTATYGTCAYRRFPAECVERLMRGNAAPESVTVSALLDCINMTREWVRHAPFRLPTGLRLVLGDVHKGGTGTPGMVTRVMAWRQSVAGVPGNCWDALRQSNEKYLALLRALIQQSRDATAAHREAVEALSKVTLARHTARNGAEAAWMEAATCAAASRRHLREMGEEAGVAIEPPELTALLDATANISGVFAVGCPGAGGYDAVFALALGDEVCAAVERFWESYASMQVCPLLVREDAAGLVVF